MEIPGTNPSRPTRPQPSWGKTGHYTIASLACEQVTPMKLHGLMTANLDRVSIAPQIAAPRPTTMAKDKGYVPLADVPDLVWKNLPSAVKGGRDTAFRTGPEHPNHYADIDEPLDGLTLRERCVADASNVSVPVWQDYYTRLGHTTPVSRGLLPFRVWQFFDELTAAIGAKDPVRFVAAAGLMAHYVGDASQPLHGSFLADGLPDGTGTGVHSAYESTMIDRHRAEISDGIADALRSTPPPEAVGSGAGSAAAVVRLMDRSANAVSPLALVTAYAKVAKEPGDDSVKVTDALWDGFGTRTIGLLADGARTLAMVWQSAWTVADGEVALADANLGAIDRAALRRLYEDPGYVPSLTLDTIGPALGA